MARVAGSPHPRGRELQLLLARHDVLLDDGADRLPDRVRLRLGSLVSHVAGRSYVDFVGTGTCATAVLFSCAFPSMFGTFVKATFQHTYDAILAAPVDTEEIVTAEALWMATRASTTAACRCSSRSLRAEPAAGHARGAADRVRRGLRLGGLRDHDRRLDEGLRELQLRRQRGADADDVDRRHVLPADRAAEVGAVAGQREPAASLRRARAPCGRSAGSGGRSRGTSASSSPSR